MNEIKQSDDKLHPKVPTEYPDPAAAAQGSSGKQDRPGFDLGGSTPDGRKGPVNTMPGGPVNPPAGGTSGGSAHEMGGSEGSGPPDGSGSPSRQGR